jgi:hypothetical protein
LLQARFDHRATSLAETLGILAERGTAARAGDAMQEARGTS